MLVPWNSFWLFQSTVSNVLGSYLVLRVYLTTKWPFLPLATVFHWTISTCTLLQRAPFITEIAAITLIHVLFSQLPLNWILASVLILNAIPFLAQHIAYLLSCPPTGTRQPEADVWDNGLLAQMKVLHYFLIVLQYAYSIKNLYLNWESKNELEAFLADTGIAFWLNSFSCLSYPLVGWLLGI